MSAGVHVLPRDIETCSAINLAEVGAHRYATDKSTKIWCVGYAVDNGPVQIWTPGEPIPQPFFDAANNPDWTVVAHHDQFESAIERHVLAPHYGWPLVPIERHRCTMAAALAAALPGKLENVAAALELAHQKDKAGQRLMLRLSRIGYVPTAEELQRLYDYCRRDVEIERELHHKLPPLSADEQKLWELDARINARGFRVDTDLAHAAREIVRVVEAGIDGRIAALTDGVVTSVHQRDRILKYLASRGDKVESLGKKNVAAALANGLDEQSRELLQLRQAGAHAAAMKPESILACADADQRIRDGFRHLGASTGRWSGSKSQPQNLKKIDKNIAVADAIEAVRSKDLDRVRALGDPLTVIGSITRPMICAAPGHVLIGADFSGIESRTTAWIAGEQRKIEQWTTFDRTGDPKDEPYYVIGRQTYGLPEEEARSAGKTGDLACGFGGGPGAWRRFRPDDPRSDDQIKAANIDPWRKAHPKTTRFWQALEGIAHRAIRTGKRIELRNLVAEHIDGTLYLTLPSGRRLAYPRAHLGPGKYQNDVVHFHDNGRGQFVENDAWYGQLVENVVQAVARDLLAAAMLRLEAAGFPIVSHVHDEIVAEVLADQANKARFLAIMTQLPDWAAGLPIAAKAWTSARYGLEDEAPAIVTAPKINCDVITEKIIAIGRPLISIAKNGGDHVGNVAPPCRQQTDDSTLALALQIWNAARPIAGTPALRYLAEVRGIDTDALPDTISTTLRFHSSCVFGSGIRLPCLIALYRDVVSDAPAGIHRIALTPDVLAGGKVQRRTLGSWPTPRAIKLWPATDQLFLGEGIETVLAAATRLHYRDAPMRPAWAAGSSGNIGKFPVLPKVDQLTLLVDHDASGEKCAASCRLRWREADRMVVRLQTDRLGTDFNDLVLERRAS
jgi:hypothetical protein